MDAIYPLLVKIADIKGDIRYFLCSLDEVYSGHYTDKIDLSTEKSCKSITKTFLNFLQYQAPKVLFAKNSSPSYLSSPDELQIRKSVPIGLANKYELPNGDTKVRISRSWEHSVKTPKISPLRSRSEKRSYERVKRYSTVAPKQDDPEDFDRTESDTPNLTPLPQRRSMILMPPITPITPITPFVTTNTTKLIDDSTDTPDNTKLEDKLNEVRYSKDTIQSIQTDISELDLKDEESEDFPFESSSGSPFGSPFDGMSEQTMRSILRNSTDLNIGPSFKPIQTINSLESDGNIVESDGSNLEFCESAMSRYKASSDKQSGSLPSFVMVIYQWRYQTIKSYCFEQETFLNDIEEEYQLFYHGHFRRMIAFVIDLGLMQSFLGSFEDELCAMTEKEICDITLQDVDNGGSGKSEDQNHSQTQSRNQPQKHSPRFLTDFDFVFESLRTVLKGTVLQTPLKSICDRALFIINTYYDGEYEVFCTNVLLQTVSIMTDDGKQSPNEMKGYCNIDDVLDGIILMLSDETLLWTMYQEEKQRDICEYLVAVIALNLQLTSQNHRKRNNGTTRGLMPRILSVCRNLGVCKTVEGAVKAFYLEHRPKSNRKRRAIEFEYLRRQRLKEESRRRMMGGRMSINGKGSTSGNTDSGPKGLEAFVTSLFGSMCTH